MRHLLPFVLVLLSLAGCGDSAEPEATEELNATERLIQAAIANGGAVPLNNLGVMYYKGEGVPRDDKEAVKWFRKAADQGYALAQCNLGFMYAEGKGILKSDKEAVKWYRKAAEQGNAPAQYGLGRMYAEGRGVLFRNDKEAVKWYRKAADQGNADGQFSLGFMYAKGKGVPQDPVAAYAWYSLAAYNGLEIAGGNRDDLAEKMTINHLTKAQELTKELLKKIEANKKD